MAEVPAWMEPLIEVVASKVTVHGPVGELGLRYRPVEEKWELLLYPLPVEMIGGAHDGGLAAPGFNLDLQGLWCAFSRVRAFDWDAHGTAAENDDGPLVSVEGEFAGRQVCLRLLAYAPPDVNAIRKVDGSGRRNAA